MPESPFPQTAEHDGVCFDRPAGFDDLTDYVFASADGSARLSVHHGNPAAEKPPGPDAALAGYLTRLHRLFHPADLEFVRAGPAPGAPPPAVGLEFVFVDGGQRWRHQDLFGRLPDGSDYQLAYVTPAGDARAGRRFDAVVRSLRPGAAGPAPPPRFVLRRARGMALAVPADLLPPEHYQFVTPDGRARVHLHIAPAPAVAADGPPRPPVPAGASVSEAGSYEGMTMYSVVRPGAAGPVEHYACRADKPLPNGLAASVTGQSTDDASARQRMQEAVVGLLRSLQPK
jgi:hypothetical protein